jgi:hypothetical protein
MAKAVKTREKEDTDPPDLGPDQMRLYSYYKPGLVAGNYAITAVQSISSPSNWGEQDLVVSNASIGQNHQNNVPQEFEVIVPRFSLDPTLINSYYPPDGHQDEARILPHLVLNDPHYPWEILPGALERLQGPIDPKDYSYVDPKDNTTKTQTVFRNLVPWVALLVFDPEELRFDHVADLADLGLPGYTTDADLQKQDPKGVFRMPVNDYLALPASSRINYRAGYTDGKEGDAAFEELKNLNSTSNTDVIFPKKDLFKALFQSRGPSTSSPTPAGEEVSVAQMTPIEAQKYMSHVRHINTIGFPDAGVEEEGLFSIVVSARTGKLDIEQPHTQVCHLVSIENVDSTVGPWIEQNSTPPSDRIGLISLFSWIYTALPPNPINFVATVRNLVLNQQMLNLDRSFSQTKDNSKDVVTVMLDRLGQGYTLSRWRTQSGEESAAFNRGPLVPGPVPWPPVDDMPDSSMTSQNYQILDPQTGLMDLTYASAWQLGKLLAISDTTFSAALMRFRSTVHNSSILRAQMTLSSMESKPAVVSKMAAMTRSLVTMSSGQTGDPNRFRAPTSRPTAPSLRDPEVKILVQANEEDAVTVNASAGGELYNEFNSGKSNNSDWAIVLSWLCEKLSLGGIPSQYLLPEPAFLPPESLRFFHIDDFWLDCFIDGALSVANHLESDDDVTRRRIKQTFNGYLGNPVSRAGYKPQIPSYGFLIRSKLIKVMPDLRITVTWKTAPDAAADTTDLRAPVCRWTKWDDETLMALLDRQPEELDNITLAQPPHQQRFSLGSYVRKASTSDPQVGNLVEFDLRRLYTMNDPPVEWPEMPWPKIGPDGKDWTGRPTTWLDFNTRILDVAKMAGDINYALRSQNVSSSQPYNDTVPNSCELGLELNDPSYYFKITPPPSNGPPDTIQPRNRQLYVLTTGNQTSLKQAAEKAVKSFNSRTSITHTGQSPLAAQAHIQKPVSVPAPKTVVPPPAHSLPAAQKPPHAQAKIQPIPPSRLLASNFKQRAGSPLTSTTKFQLNVYPDYKILPTRFPGDKYDGNDYIPSLNVYLFDLIFAIRKPAPSNQDLLRIDIDIPLRIVTEEAGPGPPDSKREVQEEALLDDNYYGPGLRMLSNQRFIPFLFYNDEAKDAGNKVDNMHIELIPRSADDNVTIKLNDKRTSELSFRLAEAPISKLEVLTNVNVDGKQVSRGRVTITMTEWYKTVAYPHGEPVSSTYVVLKRAVTDDKDWTSSK